MSMTRVGDIDFEYYVEGSGPPLLMIMGMAGSAASWGQPFLDLLQQHFTTIRFSNRGTGHSSQSDEVTTIKAMADDANGLIQSLGIAPAHVLGVSMGGMIAQELVLNHPEDVQGLVLGCTSCGQTHGVAVPADTLARFAGLASVPPEERVKAFWSIAVTPEFERDHGDFLDEVVAQMSDAPTPEEAVVRQMGAIMGFDTWDRLPQVKAATLILHGDRDQLLPHGNVEVLKERIAGARSRIISGAGHCFFWEKPEGSAQAVVEFLEKVPAPA